MKPWAGKTPRSWQGTALPIALDSIRAGRRVIIRAATGAGKSILQAEVVARYLDETPLAPSQRILVTAPTQKLVRQLGSTIAERCPLKVGRFYANEKNTKRPIIVACHASLKRLAQRMEKRGLEVRLWIPDECHKTQAPEVLAFAEQAADDIPLLGFTATPFRSQDKHSLSLFDALVYEYTAQDAIRDGAIVPPEIVPWDGAEVPVSDACIEMIRRHVKKGPGVVNARSIDDALAFAARLRKNQIPAIAIHSRLKRAEVARIQKSLRDGVVSCVVHVNMLAEGVDFPWLRWICMRRACESRVRFVQEVGRVMRAWPGKSCGYVLDPRDLFGKLQLDYPAVVGDAHLEPEKPKEPETIDDLFDEDPEEKPEPKVVKRVVSSYLRVLAQRARNMGLVRWVPEAPIWTEVPAEKPRDSQMRYLRRLLERVRPIVDAMPSDERPRMRRACQEAGLGTLDERDTEDLIDVLKGMVASQGWPYATTGD